MGVEGELMTATALNDLVIEKMVIRHIDSIRAIDKLCYSSPWSAATWRRELSESTRHHLVARVDETVVGHAGLLFVLDEVHVTTVAVHPDRQGAGIATRLVCELLKAAVDSGSTSATLEVRALERRTQRLYARFGFLPAGTRRRYYSDPEDDALVMWLSDLQNVDVSRRLSMVQAELALTSPIGEASS